MHSGWRPIYYIFDMLLSMLVVLLRRHEFRRETENSRNNEKEQSNE
jgi:hypothetical protein